MNIHTMIYEVLSISDAMVCEPPFPNLHRVSQSFSHGVRVSAFDELQRTFERDLRRSQQQMKMFGHEHECVKLELSLAAIRVESMEEKPGHRFG